MFTNWGLQDTYTSLVLPGMISAFGIFLFRQSIAGISDELIEAAKLDGASETRIFHSIILPMSHNTMQHWRYHVPVELGRLPVAVPYDH